MVACVEEVCKTWIWLFRNVRGEGFEGSSVVRTARGKICFRLPFCRQEAVKARQKAKVYFCVPPCGVVTRFYTAFWYFAFFNSLEWKLCNMAVPCRRSEGG